jgi:hypothetical protein
MSTTAPTIDPTATIPSIAEHVTFTVEAWRDPIVEAAAGAVRTDTDDALVTGRDAIFDSCQCLAGGAR